MFDTPDLLPLCAGPFVGLFAGTLVFAVVFGISTVAGNAPPRRRALISLPVALLVMPLACVASIALRIGAWSPAPWFDPRMGDVVGIWELHSSTREALTDWYQVEVRPHELEFLDDGTFRVHAIPSFWGISNLDDTSHAIYMDGSGTWEFDWLQGTERVERIIRSTFEEINGRPDDREMRFYFQGHLPPYVIVTLDGDSLVFRFQRK